MPIIPPALETDYELYVQKLWVEEECFRFYVEQRRENCNYMELMNLWLRAPYCLACAASEPFMGNDPPDISPLDWENDILWKLGDDALQSVRRALEENSSNAAFICKRCGVFLKPWERDEIYIARYHLEEHYGIPIETENQVNPPSRIRRRIFSLYDDTCFGCGASDRVLHIDHIMPRVHGGDAAFRNLQPLCESCGNDKGDSLPIEVDVYKDIYFDLYQPDGYGGLFW